MASLVPGGPLGYTEEKRYDNDLQQAAVRAIIEQICIIMISMLTVLEFPAPAASVSCELSPPRLHHVFWRC